MNILEIYLRVIVRMKYKFIILFQNNIKKLKLTNKLNELSGIFHCYTQHLPAILRKILTA